MIKDLGISTETLSDEIIKLILENPGHFAASDCRGRRARRTCKAD